MLDDGNIRIEEKLLVDLNPAEYNPRYMTDQQRAGLDTSLNKFGLVQPIVWNKRSGNIVGGHQRYEALLKTDRQTTKVVVVDLNNADERTLNITLNNPHVSGEFDQPVLQNLLHDIQLQDEELFNSLNLQEIQTPEFEDLPPIAAAPQLNDPGIKVSVIIPSNQVQLKEDITSFLVDAIQSNWPNVGLKVK